MSTAAPARVARSATASRKPQLRSGGPVPDLPAHEGAQTGEGELAPPMAQGWSPGGFGIGSHGESPGGAIPRQVRRVLDGPASPLDGGARHALEGRMGHSFGDVRVHSDGAAADSARSLGAGAYTVGNHIVFGSGFYAPGNRGGRDILAHELAHVVQQTRLGGPRSRPGQEHEREAREVTSRLFGPLGPPRLTRSAEIGISCLSFGEARRALWSHVPDSVKEYARPLAQEVAHEMDKVVSPDTQVPAPVAAVIEHPVETLKAVVEAPIQEVKAAVASGTSAVKAVARKAAPIIKAAKERAKAKIRDTALETLGEAKGVVGEVGGAVDALASIPKLEHDLVKVAVGDGPIARRLVDAADAVTGYTVLNYVGQRYGLSPIDPVTNQPTGGFAVSGKIAKGFDSAAGLVERALDAPKEDVWIFNSYEKGELEGAIGTQVALSFVGVEEVQVVLKIANLAGSVSGLVDIVRASHKPGSDDVDLSGLAKNPMFWGAVLGAALSLLGLKETQAANKVVKIILGSGALVGLGPVAWQLYNDYESKDSPDQPGERQKKIKQDLGNLIKGAVTVIMDVLKGHGLQKQQSGPSSEPTGAHPQSEGSSTSHGGSASEPPPEAHATPVNAGNESAPAVPEAAVVAPAPVVTEAPPAIGTAPVVEAPLPAPAAAASTEAPAAKVIPIGKGKKGGPGKLQAGERPVSSLDEARARRAAKSAAPAAANDTEPATQAVPRSEVEPIKLAAGAEGFTSATENAGPPKLELIRASAGEGGPGPSVQGPSAGSGTSSVEPGSAPQGSKKTSKGGKKAVAAAKAVPVAANDTPGASSSNPAISTSTAANENPVAKLPAVAHPLAAPTASDGPVAKPQAAAQPVTPSAANHDAVVHTAAAANDNTAANLPGAAQLPEPISASHDPVAKAPAAANDNAVASPPKAAQTEGGNGGANPPSPLTLPSEGVDMPSVFDESRTKGSLPEEGAKPKEPKEASELGFLRDKKYFWKEFAQKYGNQLSPENRALIAAGNSPVVDPTWVASHPEHEPYMGDRLEHHHVGQGSRAVPLPSKLHDAYTVFHPQGRDVGTPADGVLPLPPQPTRADTQAEIDRHVKEGRIRGVGITPDTPPKAPDVPVNSAIAVLPPEQRGGPEGSRLTPEQRQKVVDLRNKPQVYGPVEDIGGRKPAGPEIFDDLYDEPKTP